MGQPAYQTDRPAYVSPEDYLHHERRAAEKHEYLQGRIQAMAGGSYAHNRICMNIGAEVHSRLKGTACTPVGSDQRVQILSGGAYTYPDLTVVCGPPKFSEAQHLDTLLNPTLLVEVLSPSTRQYDHDEKFMYYRQLSSLRQYLMLDSASVHAELYTRQANDHWLLSETRDPAAVLDLASIGCQVPLAAVYAGVELAQSGASAGAA